MNENENMNPTPSETPETGAYTPPDFTAAAQNAPQNPASEQPVPPGYTPPVYTQPAQDPQNVTPPPYGQPQQPQTPAYYKPHYDVPPAGYQQKSRIAAGLLGVMFGAFGVHNFYLGNNTRAVIQLIVTLAGGLITCGFAAIAVDIWGLVEGIQLIIGGPAHNYDGNGVILRD